ncbi:carbohydrate ABC transporter permease [Brachybacterium sp. AOP3-A1-3]|uniref:carbohydrate ABC transporter permease n=1 Tax=Brachybacterium sp. AOP3-A1-3 TaxID=3457699 RepID=UPI00403369EF
MSTSTTALATAREDAPTSASTLPPLSAQRLAARRQRLRRGYGLFALFAFPNLALIAVFAYWPIVANLYLSLTSWDFISPEPLFVGLTNYTSMLVSPSFHKVLWVSLVWVVVVVGISLVLGVLLAALFSKKLPGTSVATGIVFTPHVVSGAALAVVWLFIFDPNYGLARVVFNLFGADSPSWTTDADWALPALLIVSIWKGVGFVSIVYLAGIQGLPTDVLEAAELDGASSFQTFTRVILPLLSPTTFFLVITQTIGAFQAFDVIAVMTNGGPASSTTTLSWFIYEQAFLRSNVGLSAAAGTVMFVILMVITALQFRFVEKKVHY